MELYLYRKEEKLSINELIGTVIDIEKEEIIRTKKKKSLAVRVAMSPLTFIAAQGKALIHGPGGDLEDNSEIVQRWLIRIQVPRGMDGEGNWTLEMLGSEFEGTVRVGDKINIIGKFKRGKVIKCNSFMNESAGAEVVAYN
jgi:hypothetical protein